jgi:hypothetical protein
MSVVSARRDATPEPRADALRSWLNFDSPTDLKFNRGAIGDLAAFAGVANAASWLFLWGEDFAATEGPISYTRVRAAVAESVSIVSNPPQVLDMDLAR